MAGFLTKSCHLAFKHGRGVIQKCYLILFAQLQQCIFWATHLKDAVIRSSSVSQQITCNGTSGLILMRSNAPYGIVIVLVPFYR